MSLEELAVELNREDGHAAPALGALVAGAGMVLLGIGAANDTGWLAVAGGIIAAIAIVAAVVIDHVTVDYDVYRRLEALEGKDKQ